MSREQLVGLIVLGGALILVSRGLLARRLSGRRLLMLATVWAAIFASGVVLVTIVHGMADRSSEP